MLCSKKIPGDHQQILSLDGLRGIAIILVLLRHGIEALKKDYPLYFQGFNENPIITFMVNGWAGVDLFFVLSGFLVGYHLLNHWPKKEYSKLVFIAKYWIKRGIRVLPLYYVIIVIVILDIVPFYQHSSLSIAKSVIRHVVFLQDYFSSDLLVSLWSLATEIKFYFLSPFLLWYITQSTSQKRVFFLFFFLLSFILINRLSLLYNEDILNYSDFFWSVRAPFHMAFDCLVLGIIVAYLYHHKFFNIFLKRYNSHIFKITGVLLVMLLVASDWMGGTNSWTITVVILFVLSILFSVLVYSALYIKGNSLKFLSNLKLRYLAKISYSLYLCHMLLIPSALYFSKAVNEGMRICGESWPILSIVIFFVTYLTLSLLMAIVLHLIIEKPFLNLKRYIRL